MLCYCKHLQVNHVKKETWLPFELISHCIDFSRNHLFSAMAILRDADFARASTWLFTMKNVQKQLNLVLFYTTRPVKLNYSVCLLGNKSAYEPSGPPGRSLSRFPWHEATRNISTPPGMGCQSIAGLPPALNSPVPIYTPGWREAP